MQLKRISTAVKFAAKIVGFRPPGCPRISLSGRVTRAADQQSSAATDRLTFLRALPRRANNRAARIEIFRGLDALMQPPATHSCCMFRLEITAASD
jgi:hypothetical protein